MGCEQPYNSLCHFLIGEGCGVDPTSLILHRCSSKSYVQFFTLLKAITVQHDFPLRAIASSLHSSTVCYIFFSLSYCSQTCQVCQPYLIIAVLQQFFIPMKIPGIFREGGVVHNLAPLLLKIDNQCRAQLSNQFRSKKHLTATCLIIRWQR